MSKIFISHATADAALAKLVVNFLKEAIGVKDADIFCTSLPGHSIPLAEDFNQYIRDQIEQPYIVVVLLTPSYFDSDFCLMELGAAWSRSLKTLAVVIPDVSFDVVTKTLGLKQAWRISDHTRLSEFKDTFKGMELETRSSATWEGKAAEWKRRLPGVLRGLPASTLTSKNNLDSALAEVERLKRAAAREAERATNRRLELEEENAALRRRLADNEAGLPRVLIVESEPLVAMDLKQMLMKARYDVVGIARTKEEAFIAAIEQKAEIILTETVLADGSSGIEAMNHLYPLLDCVAIFVTAYPERLLSGSRPEPTYLVTKPFTPALILENVSKARKLLLEKRALAERQAEREKAAM
ncbi:TIR domain-containing protein [Rhizobium leguminosarum bv. viciae]|uniref:TIR domain-containing protein n=1 Tax=Rhizobium leguminosarum TaxID=384 RepID=UPI00103DC84D|nr:TIR domain-containing protein [Rhizobium leguminosarum]TBZ30963.1 TIR domain-containing protein [Rhizobium leguminosarum bv. viciae]